MPRQTKTRRAPALSFNHAMVYARDVSRALHFYVDQLGLKLVEEWSHEGRPVYARLRSPRGQTTIALHALEPGKNLPDGVGIRLYFEVEQLEQLCRKLERAGVKLLQPPKMMPWGWKHAYVNDPDGHELSLYWAGTKRLRKSR